MVLCLVTLTDLQTRRAGLSASAELLVSLWNSLPTHVITAVSVGSFKNRLDNFGANEEARFDLPTYLAAVLQDASKSYVSFLLLCTIVYIAGTEASGLCP